MTRAVRILAALLLLPALMGADGSCQRKGQVHTDRPPQDRQVDPKRGRRVHMQVYEATGPYTVTVRVGEVGSKDLPEWSREDAVGPGYKQTVDYTSGQQLEIHMFIKGRSDDTFECRIDDGPENEAHHHDYRRGEGEVLCRLVTLK